MIGCYDFCGHYEWTFEWLRQQGGHELVLDHWEQAIYGDSQIHATRLILDQGFAGMKEYWGHALEHEAAGYQATEAPGVYRIDMHECPSKGFLIKNGLVQYHDYCDHCMGWIGPLMRDAGFVIDHEHNHAGQCWWEMRHAEDSAAASAPGQLSGEADVRLQPDWLTGHTDRYERATHPDHKAP
jgi:hypothetical protein